MNGNPSLRQPRSKADAIAVVVNKVDLGFFRTAGIAMHHGRDFAETDHDSSTPVAIVNESWRTITGTISRRSESTFSFQLKKQDGK